MRNRWLAGSVLAAAAVVGLAACGGSSSSSTPSAASTPAATSGAAGSTTVSASATGIKTTTINGHVVLTNAQGFVLYWFAIDTPTTSKCSGTCATYWPPLIGTPTLGSGVSLTGKLGTIKRSNGQVQATYDGHPLYLFKTDTSAGMDSGNALNTAGGLWWAMTASGAKIKAKGATAPSSGSSPSSGSGSGGYGY
jgi:predicted lipoprotein with Yx(FWY)xxD motif